MSQTVCPELQYTKYRNENINQVKTQPATMSQAVSWTPIWKDSNKNINQVKTQPATMNQAVSWTPIYKGQEWKYQSGKNTASYYEPKCVLNEDEWISCQWRRDSAGEEGGRGRKSFMTTVKTWNLVDK